MLVLGVKGLNWWAHSGIVTLLVSLDLSAWQNNFIYSVCTLLL